MATIAEGTRRLLALREQPIPTRRIVSYLRPHRARAALALACVFAASLLGLVPALVVKELVDYLGHRGSGFDHVVVVIALGVAAAIVGGLIGVARTYIMASITTDVVARLRGQLFDHLSGQSVAYYTTNRAGEVMSRLLNDVGGIESSLSTMLIGLASNAATAVAALVLAIILDWRLTLVSMVALPILALALRRASGAIIDQRTAVQLQYGELTAYLHETLSLSGMTLVKSFSRERYERERFAGLNADLRRRLIASAMAARWFGLVLELLQVAAPAILLLAGGYLVVHGDTTLGSLLAFVTVAGLRLGPSVVGLANGLVSVLGSVPLWRRVFEVLDEPHEIVDRPGALPLRQVRGDITLDAVTFAYAGQPTPAVLEAQAEIRAGQLVALVGPSGAGKTTLTTLLARFHDPTGGRILLDGHDLRDVTLESLHEGIGMVLQDTYLFHGTLRDNLLYARPDANQNDVEAAVRAANLEQVVAGLPDGYDTVVGERGQRLSGGERQRVAIARAILKDAAVLILDEATSHLDSVSERLIQTALARAFEGRTTVAIAHRLSTVLAADLILVMDAGRIVERGTHAELLELGGLYTRLYESQFRSAPGGELVS